MIFANDADLAEIRSPVALHRWARVDPGLRCLEYVVVDEEYEVIKENNLNIVDALEINGFDSGELRRASWGRGVWLEFRDGKIVNPEILTADDLRAQDWCWSEL